MLLLLLLIYVFRALYNNNLSGSLPPEIGNLSQLKKLLRFLFIIHKIL